MQLEKMHAFLRNAAETSAPWQSETGRKTIQRAFFSRRSYAIGTQPPAPYFVSRFRNSPGKLWLRLVRTHRSGTIAAHQQCANGTAKKLDDCGRAPRARSPFSSAKGTSEYFTTLFWPGCWQTGVYSLRRRSNSRASSKRQPARRSPNGTGRLVKAEDVSPTIPIRRRWLISTRRKLIAHECRGFTIVGFHRICRPKSIRFSCKVVNFLASRWQVRSTKPGCPMSIRMTRCCSKQGAAQRRGGSRWRIEPMRGKLLQKRGMRD